MMRAQMRLAPLPEWNVDSANTGDGGKSGVPSGVVSGNPAYPGSSIWEQQVWSSNGFTGSPSPGAGGQNPVTTNLTAGVLMTSLGRIPDNVMRQYQRQLVQANLLSASSLTKGGADNATMNSFAELFMIAIRTNEGKPPKDRVTWSELLSKMAQAGSRQAAKEAAKAEAAAHQPTTTTSTQAYETGKQDAGQYLKQAMEGLLGRAPTGKEVAAFQSKLNAREQANPTVTTTHNDGYGNTTSNTESSSVNPGAAAENFAVKGKANSQEAGAYKIQQFTDALMSLGAGSM